MKKITIRFSKSDKWMIVESDHRSFTVGREIGLGVLKLISSQGFTIIILPV